MLIEFTVSPVGAGESLSADVAAVVDLVDRSGLPYVLTPMSTVAEGEWDELMALVKRCHELLRARHARVVTAIKIDDRQGASGRISGKIDAVEQKLGRRVNRI